MKVPEFRQPRNGCRNVTGEVVCAEIKKLETRQAIDVIGYRADKVILREVEVIKVRAIVKRGRKAAGDEIVLKINKGEIFEVANERGESSVQIIGREKKGSDGIVSTLNLRPCTMRSIGGAPMVKRRLVVPEVVESEKNRVFLFVEVGIDMVGTEEEEEEEGNGFQRRKRCCHVEKMMKGVWKVFGYGGNVHNFHVLPM